MGLELYTRYVVKNRDLSEVCNDNYCNINALNRHVESRCAAYRPVPAADLVPTLVLGRQSLHAIASSSLDGATRAPQRGRCVKIAVRVGSGSILLPSY